jgi:hypothetical protein
MTRNPQPPAELTAPAEAPQNALDGCASRVEAAVRREWRDVVETRLGRRRAAWIAASTLATAAVIALILHGHAEHVPPQTAERPASGERPAYAQRVPDSRRHGSYFRASNDDRPPDRGLPRQVLVSYTWTSR